ncbi:hypothetical protein JCM11491_000680 [Sporobolomyces phaffii]
MTPLHVSVRIAPLASPRAMNPFAADSPPARIAPSVSSPSLLAREPRAGQPPKRIVRPFLLRSTTPLKSPEPARAPVEDNDAQQQSATKLQRSKTESALTHPSHSTSQASPPNAPPAATAGSSTSNRRSSRPPPTATTRNLPVRASRKITFVPDPASPPLAPPSSRTARPSANAPRPLSTSTSAAQRLQAVEKRKMELKRESLMSRRNSMSPGGGGGGGSGGGNENVEHDPTMDSPRRSWSLRPVRDTVPSVAFPAPPDSPSPLSSILAERGYQDTRVVTPNSKARAKESATATTTHLAAPQPQVKEKSSMLSLRGLFSLWGPSGETRATIEGKEETDADEAAEEEPPSPNGSGGTFTHSPITRAREWVEGVAIATAQDMDRSPATLESTTFTPPFNYSLSTTGDSPASSRSYSSSIVTASSIRSPPQVTIALPASTVALSPPAFHRFPSTLSPPKLNAIKSLRHVVSDSTLPQLLPHYTSFPFSPSSLESNGTDASAAADRLLSPFQSSETSHRSRSPALEVQTSWLPPSLRHRASQVFSLPMVGLGLTSSTPLFPQPHQFVQQSGIARTMNRAVKADKRKPKLLRKAVSSAGLVRPVLTTTNY